MVEVIFGKYFEAYYVMDIPCSMEHRRDGYILFVYCDTIKSVVCVA
jgi:hypothetical protein